MDQQKHNKQELAQRLIALMYKGEEKPSPEFLQDLEQVIQGTMTEDEMRERIILRHK